MTSLQSKLLLVTFALCILGLALITIRLEAPHWFSVNQAFGGHDSDHVTPHLWIPNTIAKNVLDGDPIIICSSDYPNATQQAVTLWNSATNSYATADLFAFSHADTNCSGTNTRRIAHVIVKWTPIASGSDIPCRNGGTLACVRPLDGYTSSDNSLHGPYEVRVQGSNYGTTADSRASDYFDNLVTILGRELGHVLGLAHYACNTTSNTPTSAVDPESRLHSAVSPTIMYNETGGQAGLKCYVLNLGPHQYRITEVDLSDFLVAFYGVPASPAGLHAAPHNQSLRLTWTRNNSVRKGDHYQYRLDDGAWTNVPNSSFKTVSYTIPGLTNGQRYSVELRIVRGPLESESSGQVFGVPRAPRPIIPTPEDVRISLVEGVGNYVTWPGAKSSVVSRLRSRRYIDRAYWYSDAGVWYPYFKEGPEFLNTLTHLVTDCAYTFGATQAHTWDVTRASSSNRPCTESVEGLSTTSARSSNSWVATVTCESGPSPLILGDAPSREIAKRNAIWVIDNESGCAGAGAYSIERRE